MSAFGKCEGPTWTFDGKNWVITIPHCVDGSNLLIPKFKGVQFDGDPQIYAPDEETCLVNLPAPLQCVVSEDGATITLTSPDKAEPVTLKVQAITGAVMLDEDGVATEVPVEDCVLQLPKPEEICWGEDENNCPVVGIKHCQTGELLVLDQVQSVTGPGVTSLPTNKDVTVGQSLFAQVSETGIITHTNAQGETTTAQTKYSTTTPSADGSYHTIVTDDGTPTAVCVDQFKGLRDNNDGTFTEQFLGQDGNVTDGNTFQYVQDTDQRLTNPRITQTNLDNQVTHTITWDVIDIDGNVVGVETVTGITFPVFVDKAGNPLSGPITAMQQADFTAVATELDVTTDKLFGTRDGECVSFDPPSPAPDEWSDSIVITPDTQLPTVATVPGTCAKVLDEDNNLLGLVDDDGYHPVVHPDAVAYAGTVNEDGTITYVGPDGQVNQTVSVLDPYGNPVAEGPGLHFFGPDGQYLYTVTSCCNLINDKDGNKITAPSNFMLSTDFVDGVAAVDDKQLTLAADGSCKAVPAPCKPTTYIGDIICDEDANGDACIGVTTHVIYDAETCQPVRKVSHCSEMAVARTGLVADFVSVTGNANNVPGADYDALGNGVIVSFPQTLNFTLDKAQELLLTAEWSWLMRNVTWDAPFQAQVNGGTWQNMSGGNRDAIVQYGNGEYTFTEFLKLTLNKGNHSIAFRHFSNSTPKVTDVNATDGNGNAMPSILSAASSDAAIQFVKNTCTEVVL